jgi:paraquat-inducible protein A
VLTICPQCDLAQDLGPLAPGQRARCCRCRAELASGFGANLDAALAALATAAVLLVFMNVFPLVQMQIQGAAHATTLLGAVRELFEQGRAPVALLVFATTVACPIAEVFLFARVLLPLRVPGVARAGARLVGFLHRVRPWSMVEVFLLGVLVALVKLAALAQIVPGPALWACAALIFTMSFLKVIVRAEDIWAWSRGAAP